MMRDHTHMSVRPIYGAFREWSISIEYIIKAIAQANMNKPYPYSGETYNKDVSSDACISAQKY